MMAAGSRAFNMELINLLVSGTGDVTTYLREYFQLVLMIEFYAYYVILLCHNIYIFQGQTCDMLCIIHNFHHVFGR